MAGLDGGKKRKAQRKRRGVEPDQAEALERPDEDGEPSEEEVRYVDIRVPVHVVKGYPTTMSSTVRLSPRAARAQRVVYDGLAQAGEVAGTLPFGTTAPLWKASEFLLDLVAEALGMDMGTTRDGLA